MWLVPVNGTANVAGQSVPVVNGILNFTLGIPAKITLPDWPGGISSIVNFTPYQELTLGINYDAINLTQSATETSTAFTSIPEFVASNLIFPPMMLSLIPLGVGSR